MEVFMSRRWDVCSYSIKFTAIIIINKVDDDFNSLTIIFHSNIMQYLDDPLLEV